MSQIRLLLLAAWSTLRVMLVSEAGLPAVTRGCIWPARAAVFARCDLGGDHAPEDHLAVCQLPRAAVWPMTMPNQRPRISQPPVRASTPELIAAQLRQVLVMHGASDGGQVRSCSGQPQGGDQDLGRGQDAHLDSMGRHGAW